MQRESEPVRLRRPQWLAASCALLLAGAFAGWHLSSWPIRFSYPGDGAQGSDSMPLPEMLHLQNGVPIYAVASGERYDTANWGPLYYLLGARLVDPDQPTYQPLRILSMVGTLASAAGCALLAFWFSRSYLAAALAPLLFLSYGFVTVYGVTARSDSVAFLLCFAGFLIAYRFRSTRLLLLAIPLMLLGFFYKQQFVAGPVAVFLFLWLEKRYRLAIEFAGLLAMGMVGLILYFQFVVFSGQAFSHHFVLYNLLPFERVSFVGLTTFFGLVLLVPLLAGFWSLRVYPDKLLRCYLGSATLLSLLTIGRAGSGTYYFYECVLLLSVLFAALLAKRTADPAQQAGLLFLLGICLLMAHFTRVPRPADFVLDRAVQNYLKQRFSPQTPALGSFSGDLVRAGLDTPITNIYHYTWLIRKGVISDRGLVSQIQNRRFGVIVLTFDLENDQDGPLENLYMTPPMRRAISRYYRPDAVLEMPEPQKFRPEDRFYFWVPRSETNSSTDD